MVNKLLDLPWNQVVLLKRSEIDNIVSIATRRDERLQLAKKVLIRAKNPEKHTIREYVPVRMWEIKVLFPDYETNPPPWKQLKG